jgi:GR25 family glycosyltransferase involved in LPS biosynthesis
MGQLVPWNKSSLEIGDVPVAIISLSDARGRRNTLRKRGFSPELVNNFWPACDMRVVADAELRNYSQYNDIKAIYNRSPIPAELGCLFSHSQIIRWLSEQDIVSQVVIFEDDVIPTTRKSLEVLCKLTEFLEPFARDDKPYVCHLGPRPDQWRSVFTRKIVKKNGFSVSDIDLYELVDKKSSIWRAHAYVISKKAADRYVEMFSKTGFLADDWRLIADRTGSKMILAAPPLFTQDEDVVSTIDPGNNRLLIDQLKSSNQDGYLANGMKILTLGRGVLWILKKALKRFLVVLCRNFYRKKLF